MRLPLLAALAVSLIASASAQPGWQPVPDGLVFSARATYGFGGDFTVTDASGNPLGEETADFGLLVFGAQVPVSETFRLVGTLPIAYSSYSTGMLVSDEFEPTSSVDLGNPYLGVAVAVSPGAEVEVGAWLPVIEFPFGSASQAFYETDRLSFESFAAYSRFSVDREPERIGHVSGRLALRGEGEILRDVRLRGEFAPVLTVLTEDPMLTDFNGDPIDSPRTDLSFTSRVLMDVRLAPIALTTGLEGRYEPVPGITSYMDSFFADGLAAVTIENLAVEPSLFVRLPLAGGLVSPGLAIGVGLSVPVR